MLSPNYDIQPGNDVAKYRHQAKTYGIFQSKSAHL